MRMKRLLRILAPLVAAAVGGCSGLNDPSATDVQLVGSWHYVAAQTSGNRVTYDGTLVISQQEGRTFAGGLDAEATVPQGGVVRVNGVVSGRVVSSSSVDFDLQFPDDVRRPVGSIAGDTITGSWATADLTALGGFTAVRIR
jgi:hypothetical protein